MLRTHTISNAKAALAYYNKSDAASGYYLGDPLLGCEWLGKGAEMLGLEGRPDYEHFKNLIYARDPHTGNPLTGKPRSEESIPGWDITTSVPKGVTTLLEMGDTRIQEVIRQAKNQAFADLEQLATTRVRKGGQYDDRITGNLIAFSVEHPETRPNKDGMPDWDRHWHTVVFNLTYDPVEQEWKAVKFRPIMEQRKYFDRRFDMYVAKGLTDLGYQIEPKYRHGKYFSWDVKGVPDTVIAKFSRRSAEVETLAKELKVETARGKDKLGATSRAYKRDDLTLEDYRKYWHSRITPKEAKQVEETIRAAKAWENPLPINTPDLAAQYALDHHFERSSVVPLRELEITAMERSMGAAHPDEILPEMRKRGLLEKDGDATTRAVLEEEGRIIQFAREGKGTMRPLSKGGRRYEEHPATLSGFGQQKGRPDESKRPERPVGTASNPATLSSEQQATSLYTSTASKDTNPTSLSHGLSSEQSAIVRHVWTSRDQVILIRGAAGTGKTHAMKTAIAGIQEPVTVLAPSADASRGVLRKEGFKDADTVAAFLGNTQAQAKAKVIWVDEAGLLPVRDLARLTDIAKTNGARLILQGDPKQHTSVPRQGNMFHVLQTFAGLPVAELKDVRRQRGQYREAIRAIDRGDLLKGHDILNELGYVHQAPVFDHNKPLVEDYLSLVHAGKDVLVVAPTHAEGDEITAEIRARLKEEGTLGEEHIFETLKPLGWTDAEKGDPLRYSGDEIIQFHRNSGGFKAGERVTADRLLASGDRLRPGHFSVYAQSHCALAPGDRIRATGNGWTLPDDKGRKHRIDNGQQHVVAGFTEGGNLRLENGWEVDRSFGHLTHGYVSTSFASQGKTVDVVLGAMGHESLPAINAQQFYVTASRGREAFRLYTDLSARTIREAIQKQDKRKSATELMGTRKRRGLMERLRTHYQRLRDRIETAITEVTLTRGLEHEGHAR